MYANSEMKTRETLPRYARAAVRHGRKRPLYGNRGTRMGGGGRCCGMACAALRQLLKTQRRMRGIATLIMAANN